MNVGYAHGSLEEERDLVCPECGKNIYVDKHGYIFRCVDPMCTLSTFGAVDEKSKSDNAVKETLDKVHALTMKMYEDYKARENGGNV